jgi:uncharacterized protein YqiB (DUF1249 family)
MVESNLLTSTIFRRLEALMGDLRYLPKHKKSESQGYMPLSMDYLDVDAGDTLIALAHNYEQNGDLVADPDMVIAIDLYHASAEARSYQDASTYTSAVDENEVRNERAVRDMNCFLSVWLKNLVEQNHSLKIAA